MMTSLNLFKTLTIFKARLGLPSTLGTTEQRLIAQRYNTFVLGSDILDYNFHHRQRGEGTYSITNSLQSWDHN